MADTHARPKLDPWGAIAHEFPDASTEDEAPAKTTGGASRLTPLEAIRRVLWLAYIRPFALVMNTIGLVYGVTCVHLFARGYCVDYVPHPNVPNHVLRLITPDGQILLLIWLIGPPLWFVLEMWVLAKNDALRKMALEIQNVTIKAWLGMLVVMILLLKL